MGNCDDTVCAGIFAVLIRYPASSVRGNRDLWIQEILNGGILCRELLVRNIGVVQGIEDIKNTLVGLHFGKPVLVRDIAEVVEAARLKRGDGSFNGKPSVVVTI